MPDVFRRNTTYRWVYWKRINYSERRSLFNWATDHSWDSRFWGPVKLTSVIGKHMRSIELKTTIKPLVTCLSFTPWYPLLRPALSISRLPMHSQASSGIGSSITAAGNSRSPLPLGTLDSPDVQRYVRQAGLWSKTEISVSQRTEAMSRVECWQCASGYRSYPGYTRSEYNSEAVNDIIRRRDEIQGNTAWTPQH